MFRMIARAAATLGLATVLAGGVVALPASASADAWNHDHPGRSEFNHRLIDQRHRINHERRDREISRHEAWMLRHREHAARITERIDARRDHDHGHLTPRQLRHLNRALNHDNRAIGY